jgi:hypothetical protein
MRQAKKHIAILAVVSLLLVLGACVSSPAQPAAAETPSSETAGSGTLGEYSVSITGCAPAKTYEDKDAVVVTYSWTNNSQNTADFLSAFNTMVSQNGVKCDTAIVTDDSGYNADNQTKDVGPGESLDVQVVYLLQDTANPIDVSVFEFLSTTNETVTQTFDIAK